MGKYAPLKIEFGEDQQAFIEASKNAIDEVMDRIFMELFGVSRQIAEKAMEMEIARKLDELLNEQ